VPTHSDFAVAKGAGSAERPASLQPAGSGPPDFAVAKGVYTGSRALVFRVTTPTGDAYHG